MTEAEFLSQVLELATLLGWEAAHFRPAQTSKGWRTPVQGSLGKGWPDLVLVKGARLIFAELKTEKGKISDDQSRVLDLLMRVINAIHALGDTPVRHNIEAQIWRPSDWDRIEAILR